MSIQTCGCAAAGATPAAAPRPTLPSVATTQRRIVTCSPFDHRPLRERKARTWRYMMFAWHNSISDTRYLAPANQFVTMSPMRVLPAPEHRPMGVGPMLAALAFRQFIQVGHLTIIDADDRRHERSEELTSELQTLIRNSYAVSCLKKHKKKHKLPAH